MSAPVHPASPRYPLLLRALLKVVRPDSRQGVVAKWLVLTFIPLFGYFYWGAVYFSSWWVFVSSTLLLAAVGALCIAGASYGAERIANRYPGPDQTALRVVLHLSVLLLISLLTTVFITWGLARLHLFGFRFNPTATRSIMLAAFVVACLLVTLTEVAYALGQWQTHQLGAEQLEQQQLRSQLDAVKQQVNPHFLFNSLSSLSVLISEDPHRAERFVDELAQVYRYQLQAHQGAPGPAQLVPLEAELRFLHAYAYLLRTRYGASLHLELAPPETCPPGQLLPLTLQTLVDNAIRHNALSARQPLRIAVELEGGSVRVRNTRLRRPQRALAAHEGLADLQARYQLLGGPALHIEAGEAEFRVTVPVADG